MAAARGRPRHLDRGLRLVVLSAATLIPLACSSTAANSSDTGTGSVACASGGLGGSGGAAGTNGAAGSAGIAGGGDVAGSGGAGIDGTGTAGTGQPPLLPACPADEAVTHGICFVSDADVLPVQSPNEMVNIAGPRSRTVTNVGKGSAPGSCESARWFGASATSDWWFQTRDDDKHLWTIGVHGLGTTPPVRKGDTVVLNLFWRGWDETACCRQSGLLELTDLSGTPLLWATATQPSSPTGRFTIAPGAPVCSIPGTDPCNLIRTSVEVTVNGAARTLMPFSTSDVAGYRVSVGQFAEKMIQTGPVTSDNVCSPDFIGLTVDAAAAKLPACAP